MVTDSKTPPPSTHLLGEEALQVCRERRYAWALTEAELAKDARELLEELDSFSGLEYDSDSEVACQRSHSIISALLERFAPPLCEDEGCPHHGKPHVCKTSPPSDAMRFFSEKADQWGALEWFDRLAKAIREQDKALLAKDEISFDTYRMIAASSALALVREHEATVRAALAATPSPQPNVTGLDDATKQKLLEALRFSASRSVMSAEDERRILSVLEAPASAQHVAESIVCDVLTMQHSSGFPDHFTRVRVGRRELTLFMSKIKGRCEYHAAELNWLLNGAEKPHILDFSDDEPAGLSDYLKSLEGQGNG
jgi:hypothetical protein